MDGSHFKEAEISPRLGILGGTFDPIHMGHLRTAEEIGGKLALKKVYLIPSASPPHKTRVPLSRFEHRVAMTRLGAAESSALEAVDLESKRSGLSYSIETLRELHQTLHAPEIFFILGTDAFLEIKTWKEYEQLFHYAHFVIITRSGFNTRGLEGLFSEIGAKPSRKDHRDLFIAPSGKKIMVMSTTLMDISSTGVRRRVKEGKSIRFLVPHTVIKYIEKKRLYLNHGIC